MFNGVFRDRGRRAGQQHWNHKECPITRLKSSNVLPSFSSSFCEIGSSQFKIIAIARKMRTLACLLGAFSLLSPYFQSGARAINLKPLPRDGLTELPGYEDLAYQAVRWEPLCGNIGTIALFFVPNDFTHASTGDCTAAIESFVDVPDTFGLYNVDGDRLQGAQIGVGDDKCMCVALRQVSSNQTTGAVCIWITGAGAIATENVVDTTRDGYRFIDVPSGNYRPNVGKALPLCNSAFDLNEAKKEWSSTAAQALTLTGTENTLTVGNDAGDRTATEVTTEIPTVVSYTSLASYTTTNSNGEVEVLTSTRVTQAPVVTVTDGAQSQEGLAQTDKIALGVGLGIGIPVIVLGIVIAVALLRLKGRQKSEAGPMTYGGIDSSR